MGRDTSARTLLLSVFIPCFLLAGCGGGGGTVQTVDTPSGIQYLFVQSADGGTLVPAPDDPDVYLLTLKGARPTTTYFSDRPYRLSGYIETGDFVASWSDASDDSFLQDPPNAALQIDGADPSADVVIVELEQALHDPATATLKYRVRLVQKATDSVPLFHARADAARALPASFGPASLFIDSWASKAWKKVKKTASDVASDVEKQAADDASKLKKAVSSYEQGVIDTAGKLDALAGDVTKIAAMGDEAFLRLISLPLPGGLGKCIDAVPGALPFDPAGLVPRSLKNVRWMENLAGTIAGRRLADVAMPGSHDSGTYPISGASPLLAEASKGALMGDALVLAANWGRVYFPQSYPIGAYAAGWGRAQRHTIAAQLGAGVRYFDLRMIPDPLAVTFEATHVFAGAELTPMLEDMAVFLAANPKEIVVLDLQHMFSRLGEDNGMTGADAENLLARLVLAFGSKMITRGVTASPQDMKVSEIWQRGLQVLVLFEPGTYERMSPAAQQMVWPADGRFINRTWPNVAGWSLIQNRLDLAVPTIGNARLEVVQTQSTLTLEELELRIALGLTIGAINAQYECLKDAAGIPGDLLDSMLTHRNRLIRIPYTMSLMDEASSTNPQARGWLQRNKLRHVVIADFIADYPDLVDTIIDANR